MELDRRRGIRAVDAMGGRDGSAGVIGGSPLDGGVGYSGGILRVARRDVYGRVQCKSITNMSCYPPRDPRLRYPASHYAPSRQTVEQPLTTPIPGSGQYTKRQPSPDPMSRRSFSYGYEPSVHDDRSRQKLRIVSDSGYDSLRDHSYATEEPRINAQRYQHPNVIDQLRNWDGYPSRHAPSTNPINARSTRNGTDRTSYEFDILPPPIQPTEKRNGRR
jgi:hypothetical protein